MKFLKNKYNEIIIIKNKKYLSIKFVNYLIF